MMLEVFDVKSLPSSLLLVAAGCFSLVGCDGSRHDMFIEAKGLPRTYRATAVRRERLLSLIQNRSRKVTSRRRHGGAIRREGSVLLMPPTPARLSG